MNEMRPQRIQDTLLWSVLAGVRTQALTYIYIGPWMVYGLKPHCTL